MQSDEAEKKVTCRFDWHQTPSTVTITVYAKLADPTKTTIDANKVTAKLNVVFDAGMSYFNKSFVLRGVGVLFVVHIMSLHFIVVQKFSHGVLEAVALI